MAFHTNHGAPVVRGSPCIRRRVHLLCPARPDRSSSAHRSPSVLRSPARGSIAMSRPKGQRVGGVTANPGPWAGTALTPTSRPATTPASALGAAPRRCPLATTPCHAAWAP
jgi:hypothetical protein